jgi:hypothetical protein
MKSALSIETRRSRRQRESNPIRIAIASEGYGVEHQAFTIDESLCGVRIRAVVPLSPGEAIAVSRREGSLRTIPARVVWVRRPISSAEYIAGLEFLSTN